MRIGDWSSDVCSSDLWLTVRRRLEGVAAIQETSLDTLSRREAQIEIAFVGDEQRLTRALAQRDLFLALRPDSHWELTRSATARPPAHADARGPPPAAASVRRAWRGRGCPDARL